jgi:DNA polymerase-3 subunit alpha
MSEFVHLHTHSDHSLRGGLSRVAQLVGHAKEWGMLTIALTVHGTLSGAVPLVTEAAKAGLKSIIGCEVYMAARGMLDQDKDFDQDGSRLVSIVENEVGYKNLRWAV